MRTKLALVAAVILGFLAAIGVRSYITQKEIEIDQPHTRVSVVVARETVNRGALLREHMVKPFDTEVAMVTDMHILWNQRGSWLGQPVARKISVDQPIMKEYFLRPENIDEASQKIGPGMRAVTIGTDQISGVAGLLVPGSRVDVLGTFRVTASGPQGAATVVTKLIAQNVQVLATDRRTSLSIPLRGGRRSGRLEQGYSSITLHVSAMEALLLTFAQNTGKLSFTLRYTDDDDTGEKLPEITLEQFDSLIHEAARMRALKAKSTPTP